MKFGSYLHSSHLQYGFKAGSSTTLCTAFIKIVVSRYINGSKVLGCFLDAFDRVDHGLLFQKLAKRHPSCYFEFSTLMVSHAADESSVES